MLLSVMLLLTEMLALKKNEFGMDIAGESFKTAWRAWNQSADVPSKLKDDTGSLVTAGIHSIKEFPDSRHRLRADMGFVKGDVLGCECFLLLDIEVNWERR